MGANIDYTVFTKPWPELTLPELGAFVHELGFQGVDGLAFCPRIAKELQNRGFSGDVCLTAEYSDHDEVDRLIGEDIRFAKSLFDSN